MADHQDIVEQVKAANPIEEVVQEFGFPLPQRGRYRKCNRAGLGGLVVDTQKQIYHWYSKGEWGDVIAWVQSQRGYDFRAAVEELARRAHLPEVNWGDHNQAARMAARMREEALDVAQRVFGRWLRLSDEGRAYVERRGWAMWGAEDEQGNPEPGPAVLGMLGFSGTGTAAEREEMRTAMVGAGVDPDSPAAVSILGMRGDVVGWAGRHGITLDDNWLAGGYIPGMIGHKRLVYPHVRNGRITYLSGRSIDSKMHYNLPEALVGKKQPYVNYVWRRDDEMVVVVEGQADALSLAALGIGAVALGGVQVVELAGALKGLLEKNRVVYVGLDADTAGTANAWKVADVLGPLVRLVRWNEGRKAWAGAGASADEVVRLAAGGKVSNLPEWMGAVLGTLPPVRGEHGFSQPGVMVPEGGLRVVGSLDDLLLGMRQVYVDGGEAQTVQRGLLRELLDAAPCWVDGDGHAHEVKDANDLLRAMVGAGLSAEEQGAYARELLNQARTYVETVAAWAGGQAGAARDDALKTALQVVGRLNETDMAIYRRELAKALGVTVREMANMIKALSAAAAKDEASGEPIFTWGGLVDGWLIEYLYDAERERAALAWRDPEGRIDSGESVTINGRLYRPAPVNDVVRSGAVLFPSKLGEGRDIHELVAYIELYLRSVYLMPSERTARLMSYYVLLTWMYDAFETVIYLRAMGGAGSGKSELMRRIGLVCYRTMQANGAGSTSSLFRSLERYRGTVFIDEADITDSDTENDMVKFYNLGAMRNNPIWRTVEVTGANGQRDWEAVSFQTFCPKLIAMRKDFRDDAIGSRSLTFKLQPREVAELKAAGIPLSITAAMRQRAQALRNLLVRWRLKNWQPDIEIDSEIYDLSISARLNQVAGPLLAIAAEDPAQQEEIRRNLREYYQETILSQSMTLTARVIEALWKIYRYPDLHQRMVRVEANGDEMIKIGDVTEITNQIMNEMNNEESEEDDDKKRGGNRRDLKPHRVGRILREELQMQVSNRTRDGFFVYWNEPRLVGLSTRYGVDPDEVSPKAEPQQSKKAAEPEQGRLVN